MAKTIHAAGNSERSKKEKKDRKRDGKITSKNGQDWGFGDSLRAVEDREGWNGIVCPDDLQG